MQGSETKRGGYLIAVIILVVCWYILSVIISSPALPSPYTVFFAFVSKVEEGLLEHFVISTCRVIYAISLALSFAVPVGLLSYEKALTDS